MATMKKSLLPLICRIAVPLCMLFLPSFCAGLLTGQPAAGWNPVATAMLWTVSVPEFFAYSPAYCCGALFSLALCLYWFERFPGFFYGMLLFFASLMAGPTWTVIVRGWHYLS